MVEAPRAGLSSCVSALRLRLQVAATFQFKVDKVTGDILVVALLEDFPYDSLMASTRNSTQPSHNTGEECSMWVEVMVATMARKEVKLTCGAANVRLATKVCSVWHARPAISNSIMAISCVRSVLTNLRIVSTLTPDRRMRTAIISAMKSIHHERSILVASHHLSSSSSRSVDCLWCF